MSLYPCPMCSGWLFRDGDVFLCDECDFSTHYTAYVDDGDDTQPILAEDLDVISDESTNQ